MVETRNCRRQHSRQAAERRDPRVSTAAYPILHNEDQTLTCIQDVWIVEKLGVFSTPREGVVGLEIQAKLLRLGSLFSPTRRLVVLMNTVMRVPSAAAGRFETIRVARVIFYPGSCPHGAQGVHHGQKFYEGFMLAWVSVMRWRGSVSIIVLSRLDSLNSRD